MCGIFCSVSPSRVMPALQGMIHRGPDAQRAERMGNFCMGFARLAIVDVAAPEASQPYLSSKSNLVVFNGEIYNYRKLWGAAPSEVALIAEMLDEGLDPRQFFDGDYAIVHYNPSIGRVTLYRDRFGVCPLYYQTSPYIEVSSEARRLFNPKEVPAHGKIVLDLKTSKVVESSIFSLYGATQETILPRRLCSEIEEAVATRATHTESNFSLTVSGGLDSTAILAALSHMLGDLSAPACLVTAFSEKSEDLKYARILADFYDFNLREIILTPEVIEDDYHAIIEHMDCHPSTLTPMRYRGALRSWFVAKHSPTRVILCGDGVDELLGGYPNHEKTRNYRTAVARLSSLRSMQHFNLDRTNKMGMAWSKEFRPPMLASSLSQLLLGADFMARKEQLRKVLTHLGVPRAVVERESKYSPDELALDTLFLKGEIQWQRSASASSISRKRAAVSPTSLPNP